MDVDQPEASTSRLTRLETSYDPLEPLSSSFIVEKAAKSDKSAFKNQYASVYFSRLMALKKIVKENAERRWRDVVKRNPTAAKTQRVLDIAPGSLCFVVGTVYMEMRLKPNILEDLSREQYVAAPPPRAKFLSDDDEVMLEDESGRVRLVGKVIEERKFPLVTGVIAAFLGAENASGDFEVIDMCFAGLPPQPSTSSKKNKEKEKERDDDVYVAILSGLDLGTNEQASDYRVGLLAEWLLGESGSAQDKQLASQVNRLILAGNSMCQPVRTGSVDTTAIATEGSAGTMSTSSSKDKKPKKAYGYDSSTYSSAPTAQLDNFLQELLPSVDIDIMSGEKDPNGSTLPQQPLHSALLPNAAMYEGFKRQTNPFWCEIGGRSFLGTSGQNIDDIYKYLTDSDRLEMASSTLSFSHIAPTAPDTLFCYPFQDRDPFILNRTPDVYFVGNQPYFASKLVTNEEDGSDRGAKGTSPECRVILVPKFAETGEIVLLNTRTLQAKAVRFA